MNKKKQAKNVYAEDIKGKPIHVDQAESGRKGYHCLGCGKEMEARKSKINSRASYFAHVPINVQIQTGRECTYSDETYRHKLAKETLQRIKKIKVPNLYKYPPAGLIGKINKLANSKYIEAFEVKNEIQFYENEEGVIQYGRNLGFKEEGNKHLLIRPDVTFFNEYNIPILFIEIVATHKVDSSKLSKLKRLGIDTIQVSIPKGSPGEIEETFHKTNRTEWLFNYEQETTPYLFIPQGSNQGVSPNNEFQRKLFEQYESYECKKAQLSNLIRTIKKCLGSESYKSTERGINSELFRVKENTEKHHRRLEDIREKASDRANKRTQSERERIKSEESNFETRREQFQQKTNDLGKRYQYKKSELINEEEQLARQLTNARNEFRASCEEEIERIEEQIEQLGGTPISFRNEIDRLGLEERTITENISSQIQRIKDEEDTIDRRRKNLGEIYKQTGDGIKDRIREKEKDFESRINSSREQLTKRAEGYRERISKAVEDRNGEGDYPINQRIKNVLHKRGILGSIRDNEEEIKRLNIIKRILESGDFKKWI
ncbi:hypothetical protein [Aureispira anguillae]|uniref:Uncharacterized protein n=1 Tax=Aureispira anguillae TaxID=2864201 RepID=A0A915YD75_9BACT|nr:hypothetical protein [Aureispira anguillae]BDS10934.1 hypothetical protein AsAng_0016440 [Aureispira anguillae]